MEKKDLVVGDWVQLHPATDSWMRGDRYGRVEYVGKRGDWVRLQLDSGRHLRFNVRDILERIS